MKRLLLLVAGLLIPTLSFGQSAQIDTARDYLQQHAGQFGIEGTALSEAVVTDAYTSANTGVTHVYLQQHRNGIEVADARVTVNVTRDGRVLMASGAFVPGASEARATSPSLSAEAAVGVAAQHLGLTLTEPLTTMQRASGPARAVTFSDGGASRAPIPAKLVYHPTDGKSVRLTWDVEIEEPEHVWTVRVDAATGEVVWQWDQVVHDHWGTPIADFAPIAPETGPTVAAVTNNATEAVQAVRSGRSAMAGTYRVFDSPVESPNYGERTLVANPADPVASPLGWHDDGTTQYTITRGNNAWAYIDASGNGGPNGADAEPDGSESLLFDFPIDFTQQPSTYRPASATNLFYWSNLVHDVMVPYGFDEVSGNFQETNFSGQGLGGDALRAEGQDGSFTNNARYYRSPDGGISRIEMYLWNNSSPMRDGDFDNGIIVHEIGHGITIRITGGPSTDACLSNSEQMGEGWSDWYGLMFSIEDGDTGADGRGIGTYALNQPPNGNGIRPTRYSNDFSINPTTYSDIGGLAVPHGVGYAWATILWDMTWDLIDVYGLDPDLHTGNGGNNIALALVTEALKMQPCSPGFVDGRDAILAADEALYDGANAALIWEAFAQRGVGYEASQGSPNSTGDEVENFDLPPGLGRFVILEATPDPVNNYEFIDYSLTFSNGTARDPVSDVVLSVPVPDDAVYVGGSASDGGTFARGSVTFPPFDAVTGSETTRTFRLLANAEATTTVFFDDDMEDGPDNWSATHDAGSSDWTYGPSYGDGSAGWFADDVSSVSDQYLTLAAPVTLTDAAELRFLHRFETENGFDGGVVEISTDGGATWEDLGSAMTQNGYTGTISTSYSSPIGGRSAFEGSSGGFIETIVDLGDYVGEEILIRFRMATDSSVSSDGWYVDAVAISTAPAAVDIEACAPDTETDCAESRILVLEAIEPVPAVAVSDEALELALAPDEAGTLEVTVSNDGERALDWQIGSQSDAPAAWLSADPAAGTIEAGESQVVTLTFDATDLDDGTYEDLFAVYANDPEALTTDLAVTLVVGIGVANEDDAAQPGPYALSELFPNPFAEQVQFSLEVAEVQDVTVAIYDVMGRTVATLHDGPLAAGTRHGFELDGGSLASGVYLVRVTGDRFAETRRVTLLK